MTRTFIIGILACSTLLATADPQQEQVTASNTTDIASSIQFLESHIAQREERLAEYANDVKELNTRVEKRVDHLVKIIAQLDESKDAGSQKIKQDAVVGLRRYLSLYVDKRREIAEKVNAGDQTAAGDLPKVDEHITKRIEQIAELTTSLPTHEDIQPFEINGTSYWNGYFYELSQLQGQRQTPIKDLKSAEIQTKINQIKNHRASLKKLLSGPKNTDSAVQLYTRELGKLDATEEFCIKQLQAVKAEDTSIPSHYSFADVLTDARMDLRDDTSLLIRRYDQFSKTRTYIAVLKRNLEALKQKK